MRQDVMANRPDDALERVLADLAREVIEASDQEIIAAAEELGMKVDMRGSAAFIGVFGLPKRLQDIFEVEDLRRAYAEFVRAEPALIPKDGEDEGS